MSFTFSDISGVVYDAAGNTGGVRAGTMTEVISGEDVSFSTISLFNQSVDTSLNRVCLETDEENRLIAGKDVTFEVSKRNYDVSGDPIVINSGGGFHTRITGHGTDVHMNTYKPNRDTLFSGEPDLLSYATYDPSGDMLDVNGAIPVNSIYTTDTSYNVSRFHGVCTDAGDSPKNLIVTSGEVDVGGAGDSIPGLRFLVRDGSDVSYCDISNAWTTPVVEMAAETLDITDVMNGGTTTTNLCNDDYVHDGRDKDHIYQTFTATKTGMIDHVRWCPDFGAIWGGKLVRVKKCYDDDGAFNGKYTPYNDNDETTQDFWVARTSYGTEFKLSGISGSGSTNARRYKLVTQDPYTTGITTGTAGTSTHTEGGEYENIDNVEITVEAGETYMLDMRARVCTTGIYGVRKTTNMNLCDAPVTTTVDDITATTYARRDYGGRHYRPYPIQIFVNNSDSITGLADDGNLITIGTGGDPDVSGSYLTFHDVSNGLGKIRTKDDTVGTFGLESYRSLDWQSSLGYCGADPTTPTTHHYHLISISESDDHVVKTYVGGDLVSAEEFKHGIMLVARLTLDADNVVRITKSRIAGYRRKRVGNDNPRLIGRNSHIRDGRGFITEFDPVVKKISFVRFDIETYLDGDTYTGYEYTRQYITTHRNNNGYTPLQRSIVSPPRTREFRYINNANLGIQYAVDDTGMWVVYPEINTEVADSPEARLFHIEECYGSKFAPIGSIPLGTSSTDYHIAMFPDVSLYVDATGAGCGGTEHPQIYIGISRAIFKYESAERSLKLMTSDVSVYRTPAITTTCEVCGGYGLVDRMCDCMDVTYVGTHDHDMYGRPHSDGFLGLSHAIVADRSGNPTLLSSYIPCPPDTGRRTYLVQADEQLEDFFRYREWFFANISTKAEVLEANRNRSADGSGFDHDTHTTILPVPNIHVLPTKDVPEITFDVSVLGNMSVGGVVYANDFVVRNTSANKLSVKHQLHANSVSAARINVHELYVENQPYMWRDADGVLDRRGDAEVQTLDVANRSDMWGDVSFNSDMEVRGRMYLNRNGRPVEVQVAEDGQLVEGVAPGTDVSFQTIELSGNLIAKDSADVTRFLLDTSNNRVHMDVSNVWVAHDMEVKGGMGVVGHTQLADISATNLWSMDISALTMEVSAHAQMTDISATRLEVDGQTVMSDVSAGWLDVTDISAATMDVSGIVVRDTLDASGIDVSGLVVRDTLNVVGHTELSSVKAVTLEITDIDAGTMDVSRVDVSGVWVRDTLDASGIDVSGLVVRDTLNVVGHTELAIVKAVTMEITEHMGATRIVVDGTMDITGTRVDISGAKLWLGDEGVGGVISYEARQTAIDGLIEDISGVSGSGIVELSETLADLSGVAIRTTGDQTIDGDLTVTGNVIVATNPSGNVNNLATIGYVDTRVAGLVDNAPDTLNTLNELAAALNDDVNFNTTIVTSIATKATHENPSFTGPMNVGGMATFNDNVVVVDGKEVTYKRETLDVRFANKNDTENTTDSLDTRITAERTAWEAADTALGGRISTERTAWEAADTALGGRIGTERTAREAADTALGGRIGTERTAWEAADTALGARIDTEENTRNTKDTVLDGLINVLDESVADLSADKFNKSGGYISGDVSLNSNKSFTFGSGGASVTGKTDGTVVSNIGTGKPFEFKGTDSILKLEPDLVTIEKSTKFNVSGTAITLNNGTGKSNETLDAYVKRIVPYQKGDKGETGNSGLAHADSDVATEYTDGVWIRKARIGGPDPGSDLALDGGVALEVVGNVNVGVGMDASGNPVGTKLTSSSLAMCRGGSMIIPSGGGTLENPTHGLDIGRFYGPRWNSVQIAAKTTGIYTGISDEEVKCLAKFTPTGLVLSKTGDDSIQNGAAGTLQIYQNGNSKDDGIALMSQSSNISHRLWKDSDGTFHISRNNSGAEYQFVQTLAGNVGIGTTTPTAKLDVNGNVKAANFVGNLSGGDYVSFPKNGSENRIRFWGSNDSYAIGMPSSRHFGGLNNYAMTFKMEDDVNKGFLWKDTGHTDNNQGAMALTTDGKLTVASNTRIGYGESDTTTPATYMLDVNGDIKASSLITQRLNSTASDIRLRPNSNVASTPWLQVEHGGGSGDGDILDVKLGSGYSSISPRGSNDLILANDTTGNVGIGTTIPNEKLDVNGTVKATNFSGNVTGNASGSSGSCTGNAATATTGTKVKITNRTTNSDAHYIPFATSYGASSTALYGDAGLKYNPSTNKLIATTFGGNVTGNVSGSSGSCTGNASGSSGSCTGNAATATTGTKVKITNRTTNSDAHYIPFATSYGASSTALYGDTGLKYNPSTNKLIATTFSGNVTGNVSGSSGSCTGNAATATTAATVTTAAQPRITSVGALTGLRVVGNVAFNPTENANKINFWGNDSNYAIGMKNGFTFGGLGGRAMTFKMSNVDTQGFLWKDAGHNSTRGAMALTTQGKLTVANNTRIGYGEGDTTTPATYMLDVNGETRITGNVTTGNELRVGTNTNNATSKTIYFGGTYGDNAYDHCVIENRIYGTGSTNEQHELLLFSGNDSTASGPDRIRLKASTIRFDGLNSAGTDRTTENTKMIINHNGNVGIGTTTPGTKLDVVGNIHQSGNDFKIGNKRALVRYGGETLIINYAGDFSSGTKIHNILEIGGTLKIIFASSYTKNYESIYFGQDTAHGGYITYNHSDENICFGRRYHGVNHNVFFYKWNSLNVTFRGQVSAINFATTSDIRTKTDIVPIDPATALAQITQLEPTTYRFITDETHELRHGLIAQSVEQVIPEAVNGKCKQFIPSVYRVCPVAADKRTIVIPADIHIVGTRLQVTDCSGGTHDITMEVVGETLVCEEDLTPWMDGNQIFVHGHEIDDFRSIDYNQVMVVNVAATKCLAKELNETKASLVETRAELSDTRAEVAELKAMVKAMMG